VVVEMEDIIMAIKPDDCIVPYGKLVHYVSTGKGIWEYKYQYDVEYLRKFDEHVAKVLKKADHTIMNIRSIVRNRELAMFNAVYKSHKTNNSKDYIKFNTHADLTLFMLRWS
jgi:hypothetical protein